MRTITNGLLWGLGVGYAITGVVVSFGVFTPSFEWVAGTAFLTLGLVLIEGAD